MAQLSFKSAGVSVRVINQTGPTAIQPAGIPAGVVGTSIKGPAFVPRTVATAQDFIVDFGEATNDQANGPLASLEWLRNKQSLTYLRVLGAGSAKAREGSGDNAGRVLNAGFVVGDQLPQATLQGGLGKNTYANESGSLGRSYILGCFMQQSGSSTIFTEAGKPSEGVPVVRGILMAPSGVLITLSSSRVADNSPDTVGTETTANGAPTGSVNIAEGRQEFVVLLNGFSNSDPAFPSAITASFDPTAPNYLGTIFNTDPFKMEEAGHYLYADWKVHPSLAFPSGSGILSGTVGAGAASGENSTEDIAFLLTSSVSRNSGSTTVPNFENFEDRYRTAETVYVTSQKFGGVPENLFKISTLDDGIYPNEKFKISIENITPGSDADPYARFDVLIRSFDDNDNKVVILESHRGVNLNPGSPNFIARIIGDTKNFFNFDAAEGRQKLITQGTFENKSRYIRVELATKVANGVLDSAAVPFGFRGAPHLVTSGTAPMPPHSDTDYFTKTNPFYDVVQLPVPFRENLTRGTDPSKSVDSAFYWGVQFERKTTVAEPNASREQESNIKSFVKYFPNFQTNWQDVVVSNNEGTADTAENGVLDADRFNNNAFTLGNVKVALNAAGSPDTTRLSEWSYERVGNIATTSASRSLNATDLSDAATRNSAKFSFFVHGGFDGVNSFDRPSANLTNIAINEEMNFSSRGITEGPTVSSYDKALDIFSDATEVDIEIMAFPGIRHEIITDRALIVTEDRFDALYVMDIEEYDTTNTLVTSSGQDTSVLFTANQFSGRGINSSFGAAYFPDVVLRDEFTGTTKIVPPSVAVLGAIAKNDAVGFPWFAPAGFTRGALETTEEAALRLSRNNMDALQDVRVNPIVSFAGSEGNVVWGQRTLLATDSSLERVNVRRLLIDIRRKVKAVGNRILFEPNREETLARFSQLVNPILKKIQDQKGLNKFLVKIDTTTTTQADIENRTIRGKIFLEPTKTLEFIDLDFVVTNQG